MSMLKSVLFVLALAFQLGCSTKIFNKESQKWESFLYSKDAKTPAPVSESWKSSTTEVFVGIASFRDDRCARTLQNLFQNAQNTERITVGVVNYIHTETDDLNCLKEYCRLSGKALETGNCPHASQIQQTEVSFLDARGPGVARYMQQQLVKEEEFCLQVDAHTTFAPNWDEKALKSWGQIGNEYAILSTRPSDSDSGIGSGEVNHLCQAGFTTDGVVKNLQPYRLQVSPSDPPVLSSLYSGAFSFSRCHAWHKVPHDPALPYVAEGEEFTMLARYWTRGYDIYSPTQNIVTHSSSPLTRIPQKIERNGSKKPMAVVDPTGWAKNGQTPEFKRVMYDEALLRMKTLIGLPGGEEVSANTLARIGPYGLGTKRTLSAFFAFTGLHAPSKALTYDRCTTSSASASAKNHGDGAPQWVPFTPDSDPGLTDGDPWGLGGERAAAGAKDVPITADGEVQLLQRVNSDATSAASDKTKGDDNDPSTHDTHTHNAHRRPMLADKYPALWAVFSPIDSLVESLIERMAAHANPSGTVGVGLDNGSVTKIRPTAVRMMKVLLVAVPPLLLLMLLAIMTVGGYSLGGLLGLSSDKNSGGARSGSPVKGIEHQV